VHAEDRSTQPLCRVCSRGPALFVNGKLCLAGHSSSDLSCSLHEKATKMTWMWLSVVVVVSSSSVCRAGDLRAFYSQIVNRQSELSR
jgi:hypothetical protein